MASSFTLHVGLPRSGTRHLQDLLARGRRPLAARGWLYPGAGYLPRGGLNQQALGYAVTGPDLGWLDGAARTHAVRHAGLLRTEITSHPGPVVISADSLAHLDAPAVHRLLELIGARPDQARVVVTARDLGGLLPALWQGCVEDGSTDHYEAYLDALLDRRRSDGARWRTATDLPALVSRWQAAVGRDRVRLVTVPQHAAETGLLWTRFAEAAGLPPHPPAPLAAVPPGHDADAPLSAAQGQLLRTLNAVMRDDGLPPAEQRAARARLVEAWRHGARPGPRLTVPGPLRWTVRAWAAEDVARLEALEVPVTGPLADLDPLFGPLPGPSVLPVGEPLAREALAALRGAPSAPSYRVGRAVRAARSIGSRLAGRGRGTTVAHPVPARPDPSAGPVPARPDLATGPVPARPDPSVGPVPAVRGSASRPLPGTARLVPVPRPAGTARRDAPLGDEPSASA